MTTLTLEEARTRVARGAAHLDMIEPGWYGRINMSKLELSCENQCILGQLYGNFFNAMLDRYPIPVGAPDWSRGFLVVEYGFMVASGDAEGPEEDTRAFAILQDAWVEAIAARLFPLSQETGQPPTINAVDPSAQRQESRLRA